MNTFFRNFSIRNKVVLIVVSISAIAIAFGLISEFLDERRHHTETQISNAVLYARLVGTYCLIPLEFEDREAATSTLLKLKGIPDVSEGVLFTSTGVFFASYQSDSGKVMAFPEYMKETGYHLEGDGLQVLQALEYQGEKYGYMYLKVNSNLTENAQRDLKFSALVFAITMILTLILSYWLQKIISQPILQLAQLAHKISKERNYSLRIQKKNNDEVGELFDEFNSMLSIIEKSKNETELHKDLLEEKNTDLENQIAGRIEAENALKKSYEKLVDSKNRFKQTFNLAPIGIAEALPDSFLKVNQQFCRLFEYTEDELMKLNFLDLTHPEERASSVEIVKKLYEVPDQIYSFEKQFVTKTGKVIWGSTRLQPVIDDSGKVKRILLTVKDISQQRLAESEIRNKNAQYEALNEELKIINGELAMHKEHLEQIVLIRTNELQVAKDKAEESSLAKSEFISNMSHELRTPLNAILGYTQILSKESNITKKQKSSLQTIYSSGNHLLELINDILDIGKFENFGIELEQNEFLLLEMIQSATNIIKVKAEEKNLYLNLDTGAFMNYMVRADQRRFKQILLNLLSNAVKYTNEGGIDVTARVEKGKTNQLIINVSDSGVGIQADKFESIFEPFTQITGTKNFIEGTGLGLPITKKLIEQMDGEIQVVSTPGKGSSFKVILPIMLLEEYYSKETAGLLKYKSYGGEVKKILLVDDNETNLKVLRDLLQPLGFVISMASGAEMGIEKIKQITPDLILLDFRMPDIDGLEFIEQLRKQKLYLKGKIIGVSATVTNRQRKNIFAEKCDAFLPKPVDHSLLLGKIESLLSIKWEMENELPRPKSGNKKLSYPSDKILSQIIEYAERGAFVEIEKLVNDLKFKKYSAFVDEIRRLISKYDDDGINRVCNKI